MKEKTEEISRMILDYLRRNPAAGDTLEGIARWWLEFEKIETSVNDVANVLESLVEQGRVRIIERKGGNAAYAIGNQNTFDHSPS